MSLNNAVYRYGDRQHGDIIGYRCDQCDHIKSTMWGTTCNECRNKNETNEKLLTEIKMLREQLAKTTGGKSE